MYILLGVLLGSGEMWSLGRSEASRTLESLLGRGPVRKKGER